MGDTTMFNVERIEKLTVLYYSVLICWILCQIFIDVSQDPRGEDPVLSYVSMAFIICVIGVQKSSRQNTSLSFLIGLVWLLVLSSLFWYHLHRKLASYNYSELKVYEHYHDVILLPTHSPAHMPVINNTLLFMCLAGILFGIVSTVYFVKESKHMERETFLRYPWHFYVNPFRGSKRLAFLSTGMLMLAGVAFIYVYTDYDGVFIRRAVVFPIYFVMFVLYADLHSPQDRRLICLLLLIFGTLDCVLYKGMNHLVFSWYTQLHIDPATLVSTAVRGHDMEFLESLKNNIIFPEFRGNYLLMFPPEKVADPFSWKDFIPVIPFGLYMILNIIFEPQLKPPVEH